VLSEDAWNAIQAEEEKKKMEDKEKKEKKKMEEEKKKMEDKEKKEKNKMEDKEKKFLCSKAVQPGWHGTKVFVSRMQDGGRNPASPRRCAVHKAPGTTQQLSAKTLDELKALKWQVRWYTTEEGAKLRPRDLLPFDDDSIELGDREISGDRLARSKFAA